MTRRGSILALALTLACRSAPLPEDPARVAYRHAVALFAAASAASGDPSYRDARFDAVLAALALVPPASEPGPEASSLARRIEVARRQAAEADRASAKALAAALAPPGFVPRPIDAPFPAPLAAAPTRSQATSVTAVTVATGTGSAVARGGSGQLPDWYRQAGYFGLGAKPAVRSPVGTATAAAIVYEAETSALRSDGARDQPQAAAAASASQAATRIYGLPGPAGRLFPRAFP